MNAQELEARIRLMVENLRRGEVDKAQQEKLTLDMHRAQMLANAYNQNSGGRRGNCAMGGQPQGPANLWAPGAQQKIGHGGQFNVKIEGTNPETRTTEWEKSRILVGFRKHNPELADFVDATAKLLGYDIGVALSPYDAVTFVARRKQPNFIWRVFSRKWQMDVQWIAGPEGGTQEAWLAHMGELTDTINAEKAALEAAGKPLPTELPDEPQAGTMNQALAQQMQQAQSYQNAGMQQAALGQAQQLAHTIGLANSFMNGDGQ